MKSDMPDLMMLKELEDALEERQDSDRRAKDIGANPVTQEDRREGDRRIKAEANTGL